ncbi:MAG: putative N-acetylmannosamine-6-phosphate 2-epimerase [Rhodospirillales bacterium]|nr:putative N-acetylmannosamine-6-phosphate 2-epimerase [Rhodospirillales bacterium]
MSIAIPRGALVVSCQAREDNPLRGPAHMAAMARAAVQGGAAAIRAEGPADIAAIRAVVDVPVIGLRKRWEDGYEVYITPDFAAAREIAAAGAQIIALDATAHTRNGEPPAVLIARIKAELGLQVLADIAMLAEGQAAEAWGADYIATTLSGYTAETRDRAEGPDLDLVAALARRCRVPVVAEGRIDTPALLGRAFACGAHAVVVGTAITNPREITRKFRAFTPE